MFSYICNMYIVTYTHAHITVYKYREGGASGHSEPPPNSHTHKGRSLGDGCGKVFGGPTPWPPAGQGTSCSLVNSRRKPEPCLYIYIYIYI